MHPQMDTPALLSESHHSGSSNRCRGGECCSGERSTLPFRRALLKPCLGLEMTRRRPTSHLVAGECRLQPTSHTAVNPLNPEAECDARLIAFPYLQFLGVATLGTHVA